jgi:Putative zinc-finger
MTGHPADEAIGDYVDQTLDAGQRADIDQHLETCLTCRRLVEDLREIKGVAASLDLREPPIRSWTRLERAIKLEDRPPAAVDSGPRRWTTLFEPRYLAGLAAAAAIVIATGVGVTVMLTRTHPTVPASAGDARAAADNAAASSSPQSVEAELRQAEEHYENAIKGLEQIANAEQDVFDPRTAATLQKNLAVIDQAISESRAALRAEPASEPAQQSLLESFKAKIALLQDTVSLINEMRKGNDAGAARIVSGLKQKGD